MTSHTVLTNNKIDIYKSINNQLELGYNKVYYVYSKRDMWINDIVRKYPYFIFVDYNDVFSKIGKIKMSGNHLFIISHMNITKIPDTRLGVLRRSNVDKLVIDNHPFISKSEVWWLYFLYMTFDKTLLGYPHSYAFRDSPPENNPFDVINLADKVSVSTQCYMKYVFDMSKIKYIKINLSAKERYKYNKLKDKLFASETTHRSIISKLKRYVNNTDSMSAVKVKHYNPLYLNRVHKLYIDGVYNYVYSDSKVDLYLLDQFETYTKNANKIVRRLWDTKHS